MVALGDVRRQAGRLRVLGRGGRAVAAELVQITADGVPPVPVAEHLAQPVGLAQTGGGTDHVPHGDRTTEHGGGVPAHRIVGEDDEVVVPGEDLRPVRLLGRCGVVVQGGDRGLDLVATGALLGQCRLQHAHTLGDLAGVPQPAVLPVQGNEATLRVEPRGQARVVEQHQREQPPSLRFLGGEGELADQPDRLGGQIHPP